VRALTEHFVIATVGRFHVAIQDMLMTTDAGYRLPDLVVTEPMGRDEFPHTALLVIEVAQTSHARDREKAVDYARAGVVEYWIVDLDAEVVTVHTEAADGANGSIVEHRDGALAPEKRRRRSPNRRRR
jgi:Uma2 family endonuclease